MTIAAHALVLAGGLGTRLWPRTRRLRPKQFLRIDGEETLLQRTLERILPLFPWDRIWIVTKPAQEKEVRSQVPELPPSHLLLEPCPRGTAAAVAWAAALLEFRCPGSIMAALPTDHLIEDEETFRSVLEAVVAWAEKHPDLVTLGIRPRRPETGYGYIEMGAVKGRTNGYVCHEVGAFHEKPERALAERYLVSGEVFWNSGIFAWSCETLLAAVRCCMPELWAPLSRIQAVLGTAEEEAVTRSGYEAMPADSVDCGVLEKAQNITVFPADFGWYDLGIWETFYELSPKDASGNVLEGEIIPVDCHNSLIQASHGVVAAVGVEDLVIVVENGAVLVCPRDRLQEVRKVVNEMERKGLTRYL